MSIDEPNNDNRKTKKENRDNNVLVCPYDDDRRPFVTLGKGSSVVIAVHVPQYRRGLAWRLGVTPLHFVTPSVIAKLGVKFGRG